MIIGLVIIIVFVLNLIFVLAMCKMAAPRDARERFLADYEELKALGYIKDETITSGCPVIKEVKNGERIK